MSVQLYNMMVQHTIRETDLVNTPRRFVDDAVFVENLRDLAISTPSRATHHYQSGYAQHRPYGPPTPAGYYTGQVTPMTRGNKHGFSPYSNDMMSPYNQPAHTRSQPRPYPGFGTLHPRLAGMRSPPSAGSPYHRSYTNDKPMPHTPRRSELTVARRYRMSPSLSIHNAVEPEKIIAGEDVRTTVSSNVQPK